MGRAVRWHYEAWAQIPALTHLIMSSSASVHLSAPQVPHLPHGTVG